MIDSLPATDPRWQEPSPSHPPALSVCLVHSPCLELRDDRLEPPLGLLYLAAAVRRAGHRVCVVDLAADASADPGARIPAGHDVYGFSTYSVNYGLTRDIARRLRLRTADALFVAGGPHATALPEAVAGHEFDIVVTGEGEASIVDLLDRHRRGLAIPPIVRGEPADDLDRLPTPAWDLVDLDSYSRVVAGERCLSILTSRGCPYPCTFCNSNIMGAGKPLRYRSPAHVVGELRYLMQRYGVRHFRFQDDIFTSSRRRLIELTPHLAELGIVYRCFARVNTCSPAVAELLHASGCRHVSFGVESGSPAILSKHAMHKGQTPRQIRWALANARAAGLRSRIYLIVGFPGETDATVRETLDLVKACEWDEFAVYPLIAYPGTPLHDRPQDFGITHIDRDYSNYLQIGRNFRAGFTIRTATFDEHVVRGWRDRVIEELLADGRTWAGDAKGYQ